MFKTTLTAAAFALVASISHAAPAPMEAISPAPIAETGGQYEELAYYCQWVTVYDYWGNWVTVWQCY